MSSPSGTESSADRAAARSTCRAVQRRAGRRRCGGERRGLRQVRHRRSGRNASRRTRSNHGRAQPHPKQPRAEPTAPAAEPRLSPPHPSQPLPPRPSRIDRIRNGEAHRPRRTRFQCGAGELRRLSRAAQAPVRRQVAEPANAARRTSPDKLRPDSRPLRLGWSTSGWAGIASVYEHRAGSRLASAPQDRTISVVRTRSAQQARGDRT